MEAGGASGRDALVYAILPVYLLMSGIAFLKVSVADIHLLMCIKLVGRTAYYHRGHIALKHGSVWNIPIPEFHLAKKESVVIETNKVLIPLTW